jgi:hypothetical protein
MSRRAWTFVISLIVIGGLGLTYLYLSTRPAPPARPSTTETTTIQIWKFKKEKLVKVVLSDRAEGTLVVEKMGSEWKVNYPYPIVFNEFGIEQLQYTFASLEAERIVEENATDLVKYGLQPPRAVAKATLDDGTEKTFFIGDPTSAPDTFYFQEKGDTRVYSVWKTVNDHFHWTVADLREKKIKPAIYSDEINYFLQRQRDGTEFELRIKTKEEVNNYTLGSGKHVLTKPYRYPRGVDREKSVTFVRGPSAIAIANFVEDAPKDLSIYGLDRPSYETIVRDNTISLHFQFGDETKSGEEVYFKLADKPAVYTVKRTNLIYLAVKPFDIVDRRVLSAEIEDVDRIEISSAGKTHILTISRSTDAKGQITSIYKGDGKELDELSFLAFSITLKGIVVDGEASNARVGGAPIVRTRFLLNKGAPRDVSIDYVPYSRDFYAVVVGGRSEFAVSTIQLDGMLGMLDRLLAGEKLNLY